MKKCPQCGREYDLTMSFCLDDGSELLYGPAKSEPGAVATGFPSDEPQTAILSDRAALVGGLFDSEGATRPQIHAAGTAEPQDNLSKRSEKQSFSARRNAKALIAVVVAVIVLVGGFLGYRYFNAAGSDAIGSIAVLPFENRSGNPDSEYLSDGLAESLIYRLSQLPNLKVSPTSSVFRYKGKETDPQVVAKELGVDSVMTGRITQRGESLIISVNLVDTRNGKSLWGEQYDRKMSELLATQREIASEITNKLQLKLSGADAAKVERKDTTSPEAYQLYLKGRYFWSKHTPADHARARDYFNQAISLDPKYARAYSGLGEVYGSGAHNSWIPPAEGFAKSKELIKIALGLDETLAEAHAVSGALSMFYDLDWAAAEREYERAIELNPNYPISYELYSYLFSITGRLDEGITMAKRGLEVDPLSIFLADDTGQAYYWARRYDEAIAQYQKAIELDPNHPLAYVGLGPVYVQKGMYDEAIAAYQKAIALSGRTSSILGLLGHAYAAARRRGEALKIVEELREMSGQKYISPQDLAVVYTGLGEKDQAIEQLNKAYEDRSGWFISIGVDPMFDALRPDPQFAGLLKRTNLSE